MVFPAISGSNLERRRLSLPGDLDGQVNLLVPAFWQRHQAPVDTRMPLAKHLEDRHRRLAEYELPVLQNPNRFSRWVHYSPEGDVRIRLRRVGV
jgi:hypothetical protein